MEKSTHIGIYLGRHSGKGGGIGNYINSILEEFLTILGSNAHSYTIVTIFAPENILSDSVKKRCFNFDEESSNSIEIITLGQKYGRYLSSLLDQINIKEEIKKRNIDILFSTSNSGIYNCPCEQLIVVHDLFQTQETSNSLFGISKTMYYKCLFSKTLQSLKTKKVLVDSIQTKREVISSFPTVAKKLEIVELGLDRFFLNAQKNIQDSKYQPQQFSEFSSGYVFMIFSDNPRKNSLQSLEAWKALDEQDKERGLVVLCETKNQIEKIKSTLTGDELALIHFFTWVERDTLLDIYLNSGVLLFSSIEEGFGYPAFEMLSLGGHVVTGELNFSCLSSIASARLIKCNPASVTDISNKLSYALSLCSKDSFNQKLEMLKKDSANTTRSMRQVAEETLTLILN